MGNTPDSSPFPGSAGGLTTYEKRGARKRPAQMLRRSLTAEGEGNPGQKPV